MQFQRDNNQKDCNRNKSHSNSFSIIESDTDKGFNILSTPFRDSNFEYNKYKTLNNPSGYVTLLEEVPWWQFYRVL